MTQFNKVKIDMKLPEELVIKNIQKMLPDFTHFSNEIVRDGKLKKITLKNQQKEEIGEIILENGDYWVIYLS